MAQTMLMVMKKNCVMKKILVVLAAALLFSTVSFSQTKKFQNMIGSWEIVGEQDSGGGLEVIDSTTILIRFMGEEKKLIQYKIDFSKSPYWFDFTAKDTTSVSNFKSLLEFVGDDMLKWQVFVDEERAAHFTSRAGELFYLKRAKPKQGSVIAANQTH